MFRVPHSNIGRQITAISWVLVPQGFELPAATAALLGVRVAEDGDGAGFVSLHSGGVFGRDRAKYLSASTPAKASVGDISLELFTKRII